MTITTGAISNPTRARCESPVSPPLRRPAGAAVRPLPLLRRPADVAGPLPPLLRPALAAARPLPLGRRDSPVPRAAPCPWRATARPVTGTPPRSGGPAGALRAPAGEATAGPRAGAAGLAG